MEWVYPDPTLRTAAVGEVPSQPRVQGQGYGDVALDPVNPLSLECCKDLQWWQALSTNKTIQTVHTGVCDMHTQGQLTRGAGLGHRGPAKRTASGKAQLTVTCVHSKVLPARGCRLRTRSDGHNSSRA